MRILFLYMNALLPAGLTNDCYYTGLAYIMALLEAEGHCVDMRQISSDPQKATVMELLSTTTPDLVGISAVTLQWEHTRTVASWIKEYGDIPVVCGGTHASTSPEEVVADANVDIVCVGEGEYPMLELVSRISEGRSYTDIANLWVKTSGGNIVRNPPRQLVQDLDSLPFPDIDNCNYGHLLNIRAGTVCVSTGRGCAYACSFCLNSFMRKRFKDCGPFLRRHSPQYVIQLIERIRAAHDIKRVFFEDEDFVSDESWLAEFTTLYRKHFDIPFGMMTNVEKATPEALRMLSAAGCRWIIYSVETGNEEQRKRLLRKPFSNTSIVTAFTESRAHGITPYAFVMVGIPSETEQTIAETEHLLRLIRPGHTFINMFYPIPGTDLAKCAEDENLVSDRPLTTITADESVLDLPDITPSKLARGFNNLKKYALSSLIDATALGYASLAREHHEGRVDTQSAKVVVEYWKIWVDYLPALVFPGSDAACYQIELRPQSHLCFTCGCFLSAPITSSRVVRQSISASRDGGPEIEVFSRTWTVTPSSALLQSSQESVDLSALTGNSRIALRVETDDVSGLAPLAFFSNPCFEESSV